MSKQMSHKPSKRSAKRPSGITMAVQRFLERRVMLQSETEQLRYLPQSVKLEEAVNPHIIRVTMILISSAILIFILWASVTDINEVTKAQGEVVPKGFVQVVQHLDGGIVTEILTGEGDLVKEEQVLLKINDGGTMHDLAEAQAKQRFLAIEAERLDAFVNNKKPNFERFTTSETMEHKPSDEQEQLMQRSIEIRKMHNRAEKLKDNLRIAKKRLKLQKKLFKQGHVPKLTVFQYKKEVSKIESEAHRELNIIEAQIAQNKEVITKLQNKVNRLNVRSPVYGLVKGLKVNTIGGVIEPGKTLMEIVPLDKHLVVEARISPKDIGHVQVGQTVRVKVSSYDFSRYGAVIGSLEFLSATTFLDEKGQPYYRGRITLSKNYVGNKPEVNPILPGMTVEADIVTGKKTILAYLLKPIHLSLKTAFTER